MKKKLKWILPLALLSSVIVYSTMTPEGALRTKMLLDGYSTTAINLDVKNVSLDERGDKVYSLNNAPIEEATQAELINLGVMKHGIFYTAKYVGWA